MIVVKMELHSAITGKVTDLGQLVIANTGTGSRTRRNYNVKQVRKNAPLHSQSVRNGEVHGHASLAKPVWNLLYKALVALGHDK